MGQGGMGLLSRNVVELSLVEARGDVWTFAEQNPLPIHSIGPTQPNFTQIITCDSLNILFDTLRLAFTKTNTLTSKGNCL